MKDNMTAVRARKKPAKILLIRLAFLLICAGLIIAVYPYAASIYFNYRQQNLINEWMLGSAEISNREVPDSSDIRAAVFSIEDEILDDSLFQEDINAFFDFGHALSVMTGILKIPSLNLSSPILVGDTEQNLNIGICEVRGSSPPGEPGNYILAGHYSRIRGRHFNRLPEIQPGASVFISQFGSSFEYIVDEILFVRPEDTWAVPINIPEYMATLITCDYSQGEPYGRVIVRCLLKR